jgi:hypothetical protein
MQFIEVYVWTKSRPVQTGPNLNQKWKSLIGSDLVQNRHKQISVLGVEIKAGLDCTQLEPRNHLVLYLRVELCYILHNQGLSVIVYDLSNL